MIKEAKDSDSFNWVVLDYKTRKQIDYVVYANTDTSELHILDIKNNQVRTDWNGDVTRKVFTRKFILKNKETGEEIVSKRRSKMNNYNIGDIVSLKDYTNELFEVVGVLHDSLLLSNCAHSLDEFGVKFSDVESHWTKK